MSPSGTGLVPQRCEANDETLQLLCFHQPLHIDWLPTELNQNLEKSIWKKFGAIKQFKEAEKNMDNEILQDEERQIKV